MNIKKYGEYYVINDPSGEYYFREVKKNTNNPTWKIFWYIGKEFEITGNFNNEGQYISIIVTCGNYSRRFGINPSHRSEISYDVIELRSNDERVFPDKNYISIPYSITNSGINIKEYFQKKHEFITFNGEKYEGPLISNKFIIDFIKANKKMSPIIAEYLKSKRKKRK